jgi:hypothetical protein
MGSSQNSAAHLENMRHRRINRMKRQRAVEMGKPVDVSLKPMALNSGQKKELSGRHGVESRAEEGVFRPARPTACRPEASNHDTETRLRNGCFRASPNRRTAWILLCC